MILKNVIKKALLCVFVCFSTSVFGMQPKITLAEVVLAQLAVDINLSKTLYETPLLPQLSPKLVAAYDSLIEDKDRNTIKNLKQTSTKVKQKYIDVEKFIAYVFEQWYQFARHLCAVAAIMAHLGQLDGPKIISPTKPTTSPTTTTVVCPKGATEWENFKNALEERRHNATQFEADQNTFLHCLEELARTTDKIEDVFVVYNSRLSFNQQNQQYFDMYLAGSEIARFTNMEAFLNKMEERIIKGVQNRQWKIIKVPINKNDLTDSIVLEIQKKKDTLKMPWETIQFIEYGTSKIIKTAKL